MDSAPIPDAQQGAAFLRAERPGGPHALVGFRPDRDRPPTARTFDDADAAAQWADACNADGYNIYYDVNPTHHPLDGKARKVDIARVEFLHVDVDPRTGEPLGEERARILRLLTEELPDGVPPPTSIVDSGGGYQALWRLREPIALAPDDATEQDKETAAEEAERLNRWLEVALGADNCHNVDRVLRLPGTVNWPDAKKRAKGRVPALARLVLHEPGRVYDAAEFRKAPPKGGGGQPPPSATVGPVDVRPLGGVDELPAGVSDLCKVVIVQGGDPEQPGRWPSRSEAVFYVACELARAGCDDATICSVLLDPDFGISASVREQPNPLRYAQRQAERAKQAARDFTRDDNKRPHKTQANIRLALAKLGVEVSHDTFANRLLVTGLPGFGPALDDSAVNRLWLLTDEEFQFRPDRGFFTTVVEDTARRNTRHPVRDYLDSLPPWDKEPRLDRWLTQYLGAEDSEYARAVGALTLIAAVKRVRHPGSKFDEMLVLEGPQGGGKSSALRILAVRDEWFIDDLPLNADVKRQMEAMAGRWIVEAGELKGMRKGEVEALKVFLSRSVDCARLAYGRLPTELPRQCVVIGTTNSDRYLRDNTGNRRFWPVRVGDVDLAALRRDLDQLWAEAAEREAAGEATRMAHTLYPAAAAEQEARRVEDPFLQKLADVLGDARGKLRAEDAWAIIGVPSAQRTPEQGTRLGDALRELGWDRTKRRFGGPPEWCYARGDKGERQRQVRLDLTTGQVRVEVEQEESRPGLDYGGHAGEGVL